MKKSVAIIGTGRVGTALALGLDQAGYNVKYAASVPSDDAKALAGRIGASCIEFPYREVKDADIIFLTVPDGTIASVASELAKTSSVNWDGKLVIHTSGALTSELLEPLKMLGAETISIHPLQTFPPGSKPERLRGIYFAIEGDQSEAADEMVRDLGGIPFHIKRANKILYHAAASIASNYLFALVGTAVRTLELSSIVTDSEDGEIELSKVLFPLIKGTLDSLEEYGIQDGLTGPIARGDVETVEKHIAELEMHPDILSVYRILGLELLNIARIDKKAKDRLTQILSNT